MTKVLPQLNHVGIYVHDLDRMVDFYTRVLNLVVTDSGAAASVDTEVAFLSASPSLHHQLVLIRFPQDRAKGPSTVNQLSFKVDTIDELRALHERVGAAGIAPLRPMNHGNALSIYTHDPEENGIELYMDLPWYVSQPFGDPLDLDLSNEEIMTICEQRVRSDPSFLPRATWASALQQRLQDGA